MIPRSGFIATRKCYLKNKTRKKINFEVTLLFFNLQLLFQFLEMVLNLDDLPGTISFMDLGKADYLLYQSCHLIQLLKN